MNRNIYESFNFLLDEYKRLLLKKKNQTISKTEIEILKKIKLFLGKSDE